MATKEALGMSLEISQEYIEKGKNMSDWERINPVGMQYGWVCPKCGRVMSPITPYCPCNGQGYETTITCQNCNVEKYKGYVGDNATNLC